ncbi:MAG: glycosyltransferase family 4 protein [bacterium]
MKRARFKVLLLAKSSSFHTERFAAELRRQGCHVLVASIEPGDILHFHLKGRGPHRIFHYPLSAIQIRRLIDRFRPDVINPHYAAGYGFAAAIATIGKQTPIVLNLWGGDILLAPKKSFLHKMKPVLALKAADCVIGDSHYLVEAARELSQLASSAVIPWGIEGRYLSLHRQSYRFQNPLRIIVPRRHERLYNNTFLIRALAPLVLERRVEITFPGYGQLIDDFRSEATRLAGDGIRYYEKLPRSEFLPFMAEHDVYLSAATTDSSPASLIEAMGLGLLPVVADIPGVREWLTPGSGYAYRENDTEALRTLITTLLQTRNPHEQIRRENLARVKREAVFENNIACEFGIMQRLARGESL